MIWVIHYSSILMLMLMNEFAADVTTFLLYTADQVVKVPSRG